MGAHPKNIWRGPTFWCRLLQLYLILECSIINGNLSVRWISCVSNGSNGNGHVEMCNCGHSTYSSDQSTRNCCMRIQCKPITSAANGFAMKFSLLNFLHLFPWKTKYIMQLFYSMLNLFWVCLSTAVYHVSISSGALSFSLQQRFALWTLLTCIRCFVLL